MIPTWYFSSSKCSPDISQLDVTVSFPGEWVSFREDILATGTGGQSQRPAPLAATVHAGYTFAFPARGPLDCSSEVCRGPDLEITLLLSQCAWCYLWKVIRPMMLLLVSFTFELSWNLCAPYNWGISSFNWKWWCFFWPVHKITILCNCLMSTMVDIRYCPSF